MKRHTILDFQTGEKVENNNNSLPQNNAFNYTDNLIESKNLAKDNCYLLIGFIKAKHGLNLHISTYKPFSGKSDKRVFNGLDYLFYSKTWKGVLTQLQAFAIGLDVKAKKSDNTVQSIVNNIKNSSDLMQTQTIQHCRIVCNHTVKSILDEK